MLHTFTVLTLALFIGASARASVNTDNVDRDKHLRSPEFLDAEAHPKMTFVSTRVREVKGGFDSVGDLTLRGVTKTVTLHAKGLERTAKEPWFNMTAHRCIEAKESSP